MGDDAVSAVPDSFLECDRLQQNRIGVLGATSFVGACLLPLLTVDGWQVTAFSRQAVDRLGDGVDWRQLQCTNLPSFHKTQEVTPYWLCVAPIWVLVDNLPLLENSGARRVVALSSTSRFTKDDSSDPQEQALALRLAEVEVHVQEWAESRGVEWVILRPPLIYGLGRDKNITEIARVIRRFVFFPLFGKASGLRQPIHVADVAGACLSALKASAVANRAYNISGGEILAYRDMVIRVFAALGRSPRLLPVPLLVFRVAVALLRCLPRYRKWSTAMAERMNRDMVFDHSTAARDFGFKPRAFALSVDDLAI